jgi:hypothetical protein
MGDALMNRLILKQYVKENIFIWRDDLGSPTAIVSLAQVESDHEGDCYIFVCDCPDFKVRKGVCSHLVEVYNYSEYDSRNAMTLLKPEFAKPEAFSHEWNDVFGLQVFVSPLRLVVPVRLMATNTSGGEFISVSTMKEADIDLIPWHSTWNRVRVTIVEWLNAIAGLEYECVSTYHSANTSPFEMPDRYPGTRFGLPPELLNDYYCLYTTGVCYRCSIKETTLVPDAKDLKDEKLFI